MKRGAPVPTRRGWRALALAGGLVAAGRVFGIVELYMLAVASAGLVGACLVQSQWRRPRLSARRSVSPTRIHVGDEVSVDVVVANLGPRATPSLHAIDYLGRRRPPMEAPLGWIESKGQGGFSYHIACQARGLHRLGPVSTEAEDAFGLVRTRSDCGGEAQFLAYPRLESLDAQDLAGTEESRGSLARSRSRPGPGEDFHALRPYEIGDDLRRVHWPSVARTGALMIRKEETQYRQRLTVALDLRRVVHSPDTLEAAVSAAASILAADRPGCLTRLVSGDGFSSGFGAGSNHLEAILMHLALARMVPDQTADGLLAGLRSPGRDASIVIVSATPGPPDDLDRMAGMTRWYRDVTLVTVARPGWDPATYGWSNDGSDDSGRSTSGSGRSTPGSDRSTSGSGRSTPGSDRPLESLTPGVRTIAFLAGESFSQAWDDALGQGHPFGAAGQRTTGVVPSRSG